ncbi:MAG TPA: hypothetical protein QF423_06785 [Candidatus Scalindua sp.]|nr:hypothetical protein [Candidatus Scalindua sp.]
MVILNQIVDIGDFSIADNLRLIVIAAIFIGIIVVLLCIKFARSGEKTNGKYNSEEEAGEDIEGLEDPTGSTEGTEEPVDNNETTEEKIKNLEAEIITKIEQLISKIGERDKEVGNKIENVIKVQEALNKMNDRIGVALHDQKSSTASVLETLVDSLRTKEAVVPEEIKEGGPMVPSEDKAGIKLEENVSKGTMREEASFDMQEFLHEEPAGISSSDESDVVVEEDIVSAAITEDELEAPSEDKAEEQLVEKEPIASSGGIEEKVSEEAVEDAADLICRISWVQSL